MRMSNVPIRSIAMPMPRMAIPFILLVRVSVPKTMVMPMIVAVRMRFLISFNLWLKFGMMMNRNFTSSQSGLKLFHKTIEHSRLRHCFFNSLSKGIDYMRLITQVIRHMEANVGITNGNLLYISVNTTNY
jgi:hypothetical protein